MPISLRIRRKLASASSWYVALFAIVTGFSAYSSMYAFRKPFAVGTYEGLRFLDTAVELKTAIVISQIIGYTISKYLGVKICSEVSRTGRVVWLVGLIAVSEIALLLFAIAPASWKVPAIFLNGLPLGMVWGLIVRYLEGRRASELILAGVSCSYILASGVVKDVGRALMSIGGISESWMPFATGMLFLPAYVLSVWLLNLLPDPDSSDVAARAPRIPMDRQRRDDFVRTFFPGIVMLLVAYLLTTAFRDFRDNFGIEMFVSLGYEHVPAIFTRTELPVALGVLTMLAALNLVRDNRRGVWGAFVIMVAGSALVGVSTLLFDAGAITGRLWMILIGLGSYMAYIPFATVLFDRIIACTRVASTAVFAIMLSDAVGYTGATGVQLYRDFVHADTTRLEFMRHFSYVLSVAGTAALLGAWLYFMWRTSPSHVENINATTWTGATATRDHD